MTCQKPSVMAAIVSAIVLGALLHFDDKPKMPAPTQARKNQRSYYMAKRAADMGVPSPILKSIMRHTAPDKHEYLFEQAIEWSQVCYFNRYVGLSGRLI